MVRNCIALDCKNTSKKESCKKKGISFHTFPKDKILMSLWLINIRRANYQLKENSRICSEHFTEDNFVYQRNTNVRYLKKDAIPTLFGIAPEEPSYDHLPSRKDRDKALESSSFEFVSELEENNSALIDVSMNEKFYSLEQLVTLASSASPCGGSNPECHDSAKREIDLKEQLKDKIFLRALKKQWLDAEIKAASAKVEYYKRKTAMLNKLQIDSDLENSSDFEKCTVLQMIKLQPEEELASDIEKKMLKQQLEEAKSAADQCEKEYFEAEFGISFSDYV